MLLLYLEALSPMQAEEVAHVTTPAQPAGPAEAAEAATGRLAAPLRPLAPMVLAEAEAEAVKMKRRHPAAPAS